MSAIPTCSSSCGRGPRAWFSDGRALMDLWIATCGLAGPGLALLLVGAEVIRLGLLGRIDVAAFGSLANDPIAHGIGLVLLPAPVAVGLSVLCAGLVLLIGAWRLVRAHAEVMRLRAA